MLRAPINLYLSAKCVLAIIASLESCSSLLIFLTTLLLGLFCLSVVQCGKSALMFAVGKGRVELCAELAEVDKLGADPTLLDLVRWCNLRVCSCRVAQRFND